MYVLFAKLINLEFSNPFRFFKLGSFQIHLTFIPIAALEIGLS